jgi:hypothetical protein
MRGIDKTWGKKYLYQKYGPNRLLIKLTEKSSHSQYSLISPNKIATQGVFSMVYPNYLKVFFKFADIILDKIPIKIKNWSECLNSLICLLRYFFLMRNSGWNSICKWIVLGE